MMRVCDYIANFVYNQGIGHVFMVSGGGMMFLSDGIATHPRLRAISTHHEQAAAMAAVSYAKYSNGLGVAYFTTGCGGTNAVTGVLNAWQDNVSCLFISGQANNNQTVRNSGLALRQFGVQEADIISIVSPITKYAVMINNPESIKYHLQKAVYLARTGRYGPVWLDIPLDVQGAYIDETELVSFNPSNIKRDYVLYPSENDLLIFQEALLSSVRPVIIAGQGIRLSKGIGSFKKFIEKFNIPFVVSKLGVNLLSSDHPLFIGRIGIKGDRAGNFAVQNADLVISIGCRLSVSSTGYDYSKFARKAKIIVVDIDPVEHRKNTVRIDHFINSDAMEFLEEGFKYSILPYDSMWVAKCQEWRKKWPVCLEEYKKDDPKGINTYAFVDELSKCLKDDSTVISDAGSSFFVVSQAIMLKGNQRYIASGAQAEMGYTLPAAIGVCFARGKRETIGITGDGSFQMNIQELQTIKHHNLPIKLFVWNNDGYASIRETQAKFFDKRYIGTDKDSGVSFPDIEKIANAYDIEYCKISNYSTINEIINKVLSSEKPVICEVMCQRDQKVLPTLSSVKDENGNITSYPLEDMFPHLDRVEFKKNMIIETI